MKRAASRAHSAERVMRSPAGAVCVAAADRRSACSMAAERQRVAAVDRQARIRTQVRRSKDDAGCTTGSNATA